MRIVAIIPAYNEEQRVKAAAEDAACFVDTVVVVDDCSGDATFDRALEAGAHVLRHVVNRGQGAALQTGTEYALRELGADVIVHFDADGQMQGEEIQKVVAPILSGEADVVLGTRFSKEVPKVKMPLVRRVTLFLGLLFTRVVSGIKVSDTHNGFRALSKEAAEEVVITLDRMAHASEILDLIRAKKLRYTEVPVTIRYSEETLQKGQSSLNSLKIVKDFIKGQFWG